MKKNHKFCCPAEIPASDIGDNFCIPKICPKEFPTKHFSSPNSSLPPEELEQLQVCIEELNNILLSISSPRDPENLAPLRNHFNRLRGVLMRVHVECPEPKKSIVGSLQEVGENYLQINSIGQKDFIPFDKVCFVKQDISDDHENTHMDHQELIDIDPCLRRNLTLNFGEVVASSPELFNIFFGIPFHFRLLDFLNCKVIVKVEGEEEPLKGTLLCSERDFIKVKINEYNEDSNDEVKDKDGDIDNNNEEASEKVKKADKDIEENNLGEKKDTNEEIEDKDKTRKINIENICFISIL